MMAGEAAVLDRDAPIEGEPYFDPLVTAVQQAETQEDRNLAFGNLWTAHGDAAYGVPLRMLGSPEAAEDVSQEVAMKVLDNIGSFVPRDPNSLRGWMAKIAYNTTINLIRYNQRRPVYLSPFEDTPELEVTSGDSPWGSPTTERSPEEAMDDLDVRTLLAPLDDPFIKAIWMAYIDDLPYDEIARRTNTPRATVGTRIHRGLKLLRREVEGDPVNGVHRKQKTQPETGHAVPEPDLPEESENDADLTKGRGEYQGVSKFPYSEVNISQYFPPDYRAKGSGYSEAGPSVFRSR